jgi:ADP-ribosylglycohydrolase
MVGARTSETDPLAIGWLVDHRLGLTIAPGKHDTSRSGRPWARDLRTDLLCLVGRHRVRTLVTLLEDAELALLEIPTLEHHARRHGLDVLRLPIVDGGVPTNMGAVRRLVEAIVERVDRGDPVAVHCRGGLGRSGLIGGAVLAALGVPIEPVFEQLRAARGPGCPETSAQKEWIRRFAATLGARPIVRPTSASPDLLATERERTFAGAVLGAAIGDAMGHPTEFLKLEQIRKRFGERGVSGFELYWQRDGHRFAPYTDDTQMAEAVLRSLLAGLAAGDELDGVGRRMALAFVSWAHQPLGGHRAPGSACLAGCRALERGGTWDAAGGADAGGCGSVMRAYPFGLLLCHDIDQAERWSVAHSKLTHGAPIALAACAAMAVGVAGCVNRAPLDLVLTSMAEAAGRHDAGTARMIAEATVAARGGEAPDAVLGRYLGWAAHDAIAAATYVLARHPDDARAAILEGANSEGDSDSIATLAGALVGARVGLEGLPAEWVAEVERSRELLGLARAAAAMVPA